MITQDQLVDLFKNYVDPELMIDIWTLGLIYEAKIENEVVKVKLTFTSPMCPYGPQMVSELKQQIIAKGAAEVQIDITFEPPWQPSPELREMLGV